MQKQLLLGLIVFFQILSFSMTKAAIVSLPRYTGDMNLRGRSPVSLTCSAVGLVDWDNDSCKVCNEKQQVNGKWCCASITCKTGAGCYQFNNTYARQNNCQLSGDVCRQKEEGRITTILVSYYKKCEKIVKPCEDQGYITSDTVDEIKSICGGNVSCPTCSTTGTKGKKEDGTIGDCYKCECPSGWGECQTDDETTCPLNWNTMSQIEFCGPVLNSYDISWYYYDITKCKDGYYKSSYIDDGSQQQECKLCPPGQRSGTNNECKACPAGTYGFPEDPNSDKETCRECAEGTYNENEGTHYTDNNSNPCKKCPAGYQPKTGVKGATSLTEACEACPEGYYKEKEGSSQCIACPTGYSGISGITGATSLDQACTLPCIACDGYDLLICPTNAVCEECTPKNCENNNTHYKISACKNGYKLLGDQCIAQTCEEMGYLTSQPSGQTCTEISAINGKKCYSGCEENNNQTQCEIGKIYIDGYCQAVQYNYENNNYSIEYYLGNTATETGENRTGQQTGVTYSQTINGSFNKNMSVVLGSILSEGDYYKYEDRANGGKSYIPNSYLTGMAITNENIQKCQEGLCGYGLDRNISGDKFDLSSNKGRSLFVARGEDYSQICETNIDSQGRSMACHTETGIQYYPQNCCYQDLCQNCMGASCKERKLTAVDHQKINVTSFTSSDKGDSFMFVDLTATDFIKLNNVSLAESKVDTPKLYLDGKIILDNSTILADEIYVGENALLIIQQSNKTIPLKCYDGRWTSRTNGGNYIYEYTGFTSPTIIAQRYQPENNEGKVTIGSLARPAAFYKQGSKQGAMLIDILDMSSVEINGYNAESTPVFSELYISPGGHDYIWTGVTLGDQNVEVTFNDMIGRSKNNLFEQFHTSNSPLSHTDGKKISGKLTMVGDASGVVEGLYKELKDRTYLDGTGSKEDVIAFQKFDETNCSKFKCSDFGYQEDGFGDQICEEVQVSSLCPELTCKSCQWNRCMTEEIIGYENDEETMTYARNIGWCSKTIFGLDSSSGERTIYCAEVDGNINATEQCQSMREARLEDNGGGYLPGTLISTSKEAYQTNADGSQNSGNKKCLICIFGYP